MRGLEIQERMGIKETIPGNSKIEYELKSQGGAAMIDFKTSETAKNLMRAFAGESQARNRYRAGTQAENACPGADFQVYG